MEMDFWSAVKGRRSFYDLNKDIKVSKEKIQELVENAVLHTPSAFNSQSARLVLLLNKQHDLLWDITKEALRKIVPSENFPATDAKINSFRDAYGTILFFEDTSVVEKLQRDFPLYKDNFPFWSTQSNGMHQYVVWTALCAEGLGASLQHYSELIDVRIKQEWQLPQHWKLYAQMPFGNPITYPKSKDFSPITDRFLIKE